MHAAGIVSYHPAQGATIVARGIRGKGQVMLLCGIAQVIEDHTWLNARDFADGIDLKNLRQVLAEIEDDSDVAALSRERSPSSAGEDRRTVFAAGCDGGKHILIGARDHYTNGDLPIAGAVGRIERATAGVEAHFAGDSTP
jgi:hypothetical protein